MLRRAAASRQQWARRRVETPRALLLSLPRHVSTEAAAATTSRPYNDNPPSSTSSQRITGRPSWKGKERERPEQRPRTVPPTDREMGPTDREMDQAAASFETLGLNAKLSKQLVAAFYPAIRTPTSTQQAILSAVRQNNDIIIRAHTGTGKSFGLLLALLSKPRIVIREASSSSSSPVGDSADVEASSSSMGEAVKSKRIASIVVVPSQELARQYEKWTRQLFPPSLHHTLPSALAVKYRVKGESTEEVLRALTGNPPHILVVTAGLLNDLLTAPGGAAVLGISTLRTLVLDEVDALLSLPGRFPSAKLVWKHVKHPPAGLEALNKIMKSRATFSGGDPLPSMGLEKTLKGVSAVSPDVRRRAHQGGDLLRERFSSSSSSPTAKANGDFILNPPRRKTAPGERPLQLIAVSATANSVLRHFLGARTGWLRTGLREGETKAETGKWLDMTGLSQGVHKAAEVLQLHKRDNQMSRWARQLPRELRHSCIVVDEPCGQGETKNWRELKPKVVRQSKEEPSSEVSTPKEKGASRKSPGPLVVSPAAAASPSLDEHLLLCMAFLFASQPVQRGLALIPAGWSLTKTRSFLAKLDIPVRFLDEDASPTLNNNETDDDTALFLIQASAVRGLDIPGGVSHVFCLGMESVQDAVTYTHLAGRAARIGCDPQGSHSRPDGHVITLLRGLPAEQARRNQLAGKLLSIASSELKMSLIYRSLDLRPHKVESLRFEGASGEGEMEIDRNEEEGEVAEGVVEEAEAEAAETEADIEAKTEAKMEASDGKIASPAASP